MTNRNDEVLCECSIRRVKALGLVESGGNDGNLMFDDNAEDDEEGA